MKLLVIIINYRTAGLTIECLHNLADELMPYNDRRAIVVDNLSQDGSVDLIENEIRQQDWSAWVSCVRSSRNGGFSAGNNLAMQMAEADFYLLLNSDARVRPGAIDKLLEAAGRYPQAGIIGPQLEWPDGALQISTFRFHSPLSELIRAAKTGPITRLFKRWDVPVVADDDTTQPIDWISFAAVLIRRQVIAQIGLMDEGYFMYFEDADYCRRARGVGWSILYWPEARFVHLRRGSSPVKSLTAANKRLPQYFYASRSRYFIKFYGVVGFWVTNVLWSLGRTVSLLREWVENKNPMACQYEWKDIWTNAIGSVKTDIEGTNRETST